MASTQAQLDHYRKHSELYKRRAAESRKKIRARNRVYIQAAKSNPCEDCGLTFPTCVMDFDHGDSEKTMNVSRMLYKPLDVVQAEIDKCDLVCANCHRIRHYATVVETADTAGSNPATIPV